MSSDQPVPDELAKRPRPRVAFWLQHLLGIGHVRRGLLLAQAMRAAGLQPVVLFGGHPVPQIDWQGVEVIYLPPLKATDTSFSTHVDATGRVVDAAWLTTRRKQALLAFDAARPHALLTETFPFGRGILKDEVIALLQAAAQRGIPRIASVRDILVAESRPGKHAKMAQIANAHYDHVLVHGDAAVIPFSASFTAHGALQIPVTHTGYIAPAPQLYAESPDGRGEVIVSTGGGAFGAEMMRIAVRAAAMVPEMRWRLLMGPNLPAEARADLARHAADHVLVEEARADFPALLTRCALSISQGGYNTTLDVLGAGCRAIIIPHVSGGQTEQQDRTALLAQRGYVFNLPETRLSPASLAQAARHMLAAPAPRLAPPEFDGAERSAALIRQMIDAAQ